MMVSGQMCKRKRDQEKYYSRKKNGVCVYCAGIKEKKLIISCDTCLQRKKEKRKKEGE